MGRERVVVSQASRRELRHPRLRPDERIVLAVRCSRLVGTHPSLEKNEGWGTLIGEKVKIPKNLGCATRPPALHLNSVFQTPDKVSLPPFLPGPSLAGEKRFFNSGSNRWIMESRSESVVGIAG